MIQKRSFQKFNIWHRYSLVLLQYQFIPFTASAELEKQTSSLLDIPCMHWADKLKTVTDYWGSQKQKPNVLELTWGPRSPGKDLEFWSYMRSILDWGMWNCPFPLKGEKNQTLEVNRILLTAIPDARESRFVCSHQWPSTHTPGTPEWWGERTVSLGPKSLCGGRLPGKTPSCRELESPVPEETGSSDTMD